MADDGAPLAWQFEILDRISGPVGAMAASLKAMQDTLGKVSTSVDAMSSALSHTATAHKEAGHHADGFRHVLFETLSIVKDVGEGIHWVAERVGDLAMEMLHAAGKAERLALSLRFTLGGKEAARDAMQWGEAVATHTAFTGMVINQMQNQLARSGLRGSRAHNVIAGAADVDAMSPGQGGGFAEMMASIQTRGLTQRALGMGLTQFGIKGADVTAVLAQAYGVRADEIKKMVGRGEIDSQVAIDAILKTIQNKTGGALGTAGLEAGKTFDALETQLRNLPDRFFEKMKDTAAFDGVKKLMRDVLDAFEPGGKGDLAVKYFFTNLPIWIDKAQMAFETLWPVVETGLEIFAAYKIAQIAIAAATGIMAAAQGAAAIVQALLTTAMWAFVAGAGPVEIAISAINAAILANPIGIIIGAVVALGFAIYEIWTHWDGIKEFFGDLWAWITDWGGKAVDWALSIGKSIWKGLKDGLMGGVPEVKTATTAMIVGGVRIPTEEELKIHSPSGVFEEYGRLTGVGFSLGLNSSMADAYSGLGRLPEFAPPSWAPPGGGATAGAAGGSAQITVNQTNHFEVHGQNAAELAEQIRAILAAEMVTTFESVAMERGAL